MNSYYAKINYPALEEATDTIDAIRTGQVDAIIVNDGNNHQIYTLKTADQTYRVFIEKMNEGAVTINREGIILCQQFAVCRGGGGLPLEKVIGLPFDTFIPETSREKFNALINNGWEEDCKRKRLTFLRPAWTADFLFIIV